MNDHDKKLIDNAMAEYDKEWTKRNNEFCKTIGITPEQYKAISELMPELNERPFMNAPLARDAFVLGYVVCHGKNHS